MTHLFNDIMNGAISIMGIYTVLLSVRVGLRIHRNQRGIQGDASKLSSSLRWQLFGEATIGLGTLTFAFAQWFGFLQYWSFELQSFIRFSMFFATASTTHHLNNTLNQLMKNDS